MSTQPEELVPLNLEEINALLESLKDWERRPEQQAAEAEAMEKVFRIFDPESMPEGFSQYMADQMESKFKEGLATIKRKAEEEAERRLQLATFLKGKMIRAKRGIQRSKENDPYQLRS